MQYEDITNQITTCTTDVHALSQNASNEHTASEKEGSKHKENMRMTYFAQRIWRGRLKSPPR